MRTDDNLKAVCDNLRTSYGDFHASCRQAGLSVDFVSNWIKDDTVAAQAIEEAQRVGYLGLESAAIQRGVHGVEKAVYFKGAVVGHEKVYSDSLLGKLMDARIPAYKKGEAGGANTFNGPTQINIMPRAENFDQWLLMKRATLEQRAADKLALSAPKVVELLPGDYVQVVNDAPLASLRGVL